MRGGAGAEIGCAGVPAADGGQAVRGGARTPRPRAARPSAATAWRWAGPTGMRMSSRNAACCRSSSQDHTCAEAFALIVQSASDQIAANRRAVLETVDPAAAHQLRIGLRRLRSALSAFRPLHDTAGPARAGRPRPGPGPHRRRAARRRRADRAHLCAGGRHHQERSRLASPARGAARPPRPRARARAGGAQRAAMVGAAALSGAVAAHHRGAPRRSPVRSASSRARH